MLTLHPLRADRIGQFADLLGGAEFGGCFCAVWTHQGPGWSARCADPSRPNLAATTADVAAGRKPGFLVERDGEVVAWVGAGPKSEFPFLRARLGARGSRRREHAWLLGCLAVRIDHRGQGLSGAIVRAVLEHARQAGARWVEATPTDPWDAPRSYRGALSLYERLGFVEVLREKDGETDIVLVEASL
jgi:GNAT superfamily N-acetyltransferase